MKIFPLIVVFLLMALPCAAEEPGKAETVEIPLDQIWALDMPGTRDIRELQAKNLPITGDGLLVRQIRHSLSKDRPQKEAAKPGFAVLGTGLDALRAAHAVLVGGEKPHETFPVGSDLTLVFFSQRLLGYYVHACKVVQEKNDISIRYRFVPHKTKELTTHFALIPIERLASGKYRVRVTQDPMESVLAGFKKIGAAYERTIMSGSFSFDVGKLTHE